VRLLAQRHSGQLRARNTSDKDNDNAHSNNYLMYDAGMLQILHQVSPMRELELPEVEMSSGLSQSL